VCCRIRLYEDQGAARAGANVAGLRQSLTCPSGPAPLAARGLTAVLARAGPTGAVVGRSAGYRGAIAVTDRAATMGKAALAKRTQFPVGTGLVFM
jgi:hypothetical protein